MIIRAIVAAAVVAAFASSRAEAASDTIDRVAERGPATFLIGTLFTATAPPAAAIDLATGHVPRHQGCRFLHGVKMIGAGVVLLPLGILASPANPSGALVGWVDALPDARQEDYCTRPAGSIMP